VKPLDGMRRTIAQRLLQSKQTVPHFYLSVSCAIDTLQAMRERMNLHAPKGADKTPVWKLSVNDFIIKALAVALQRVPTANVTWSDEGILQHFSSDVGVAVSVEGGLFTPVIRSAHAKTLSQISTEMKDLAARARARKLQPAEYQGGTTAVSNLGMYGIEEFSAIINPPHATILAVGAGIEQFVPVDGKPVVKTIMKATLSCDHRAVDGALGAQLLAAFKQLIEDPALMLA
jgi:pyruvate dehydrogenase E2 component (dihydrolipoamide acetyltransferase)